MALLYDDANTGVFRHVGILIKHSNLLATDATNLDTDLDAIQDEFEAGDQTQYTEPLGNSFRSAKQSMIGLRAQLATVAEARLRDRTSVVNELELADSSIQTVLAALIKQMIADSETVDGSVVGIGTIAAGSANVGDGTVLASKVLDGYSSPARGVRPHTSYNGVDSELSVAETVLFTCTSDNPSDNTGEASEQFSVRGEIPNAGPWDTDAEGSGNGPQVTVLQDSSLLQNLAFETFTTTNTPDDWTIDDGDAGTHVLEEATEVYRGSKSLELAGDGSEATIQISQAPTLTQLNPLRRYCLSFRYKASATDTSSQALVVQFEGTGYTAASSEKVSIAGDNWSTSWSLQHFFINLPADLPSDFKLVIKVTGTMNTGKKLYIDDMAFGPVSWHNGLNFAVIAGATPFIRGDTFTFAITNSQAGTFQEFFRKAWRVQLPSLTDGNESIDDALAE